MINFAHTGHDHPPAVAAPPVIILPELVTAAILLVGLFFFWLVATYIYKMSLPNKLLVTLAMFLITGVTAYSFAPVVSAIALVCGFGLTGVVVFAPLMMGRR